MQSNLFKILCAILNIRPNQRGSNRIPEETLHRCLQRIDQPTLTYEEGLIQQVLAIKNLVTTSAYTISEDQIT